jgi:hypothetical protein
MDLNTTIVLVTGFLVLAYVVTLLITWKGDFEAGGRTGTAEFFVKAKERKK